MYADIQQVFCAEAIAGNPAAVLVLNHWLTDDVLLKLAQQLAQPVTSFVLQQQGQWQVRWFSESAELNLCGHGSLAAAATLFADAAQQLDPAQPLSLHSAHGTVVVQRTDAGLQMQLPAWARQRPAHLTALAHQLALQPLDLFHTRDLVLVLDSVAAVTAYQPDFAQLASINPFHATILTAATYGSGGDINGYVLRYFAPRIGINEDIATGSAQCSLAPYWLARSSASILQVQQLSASGGIMQVSQISVDQIGLTAHVRLQQRIACAC